MSMHPPRYVASGARADDSPWRWKLSFGFCRMLPPNINMDNENGNKCTKFLRGSSYPPLQDTAVLYSNILYAVDETRSAEDA